EHNGRVDSIDYTIFNRSEFICSGSYDTIYVWDVDNKKQIGKFKHKDRVYCAKFSQYHYNRESKEVICFASADNSIRFWDYKCNKILTVFKEHSNSVTCIEISPFDCGKYLCSGSDDKTVRLWDIEQLTAKIVVNAHENTISCVDFSPLQNNNKNDKNNIIVSNGHTFCSGSYDQTICVWDIEANKKRNSFLHTCGIFRVKYGSNELANTILSSSLDYNVCLWDTRYNNLIRSFKGHSELVYAVDYPPFVVNNVIGSNSSVICSGSLDNTIRFWDIRSDKEELYVIKGYSGKTAITTLKFAALKKKENYNKQKSNDIDSMRLYYGTTNGSIYEDIYRNDMN
ncbi:hypothetical protein RFI_32261, partial [Reticulomyxa filosa]